MDDAGVAAAANDTYANPPDIDALELEVGHPGLGDEGYIQRRRDLFAVCRARRMASQPPPRIDYSDEEQRIWREVTPTLDPTRFTIRTIARRTARPDPWATFFRRRQDLRPALVALARL
jgi:hypothetical protein